MKTNKEGKHITPKRCLICDEIMDMVWDKTAKEYSPYLYHCRCMPKNINISIG